MNHFQLFKRTYYLVISSLSFLDLPPGLRTVAGKHATSNFHLSLLIETFSSITDLSPSR